MAAEIIAPKLVPPPERQPERPAKLTDAMREHTAAKSSEDGRSAARPDLGSLRSVRSEAYQAAEPGPRRRVASPAKPRWSARPRSRT